MRGTLPPSNTLLRHIEFVGFTYDSLQYYRQDLRIVITRRLLFFFLKEVQILEREIYRV